MDWTLAVFAVVVLGAYTAQTISGFGSMLICVTFGAQLMPIPELLVMVVPLSCLQTAYISVRHRDGIDWKTLLKLILPLMGIGLVAGMWLSDSLEGPLLRRLFGGMVLLLSLAELWSLTRTKHAEAAGTIGPIPLGGLIIGAGGIHGIYATGGPMLVYALNRAGFAKHAFRSTLAVIWLVLNLVLTAQYIRNGSYDQATLERMAMLVVTVPLGVWVGEILHRRINEHRFKIITFVFLSAAAIGLVVR